MPKKTGERVKQRKEPDLEGMRGSRSLSFNVQNVCGLPVCAGHWCTQGEKNSV